MTLFGVSFLVAGMLTCLVPISLLIVLVAFFGRTVRRMPPNATPAGTPAREQPPAPERHSPESQG
jgi:Na+-transporting methylmalonyl-CoA/oxaloacetate decarboxylase gamma subunit